MDPQPQDRKANVDPEIPNAIARRRAVALTPFATEVEKGSKMKAGLTGLGASGIGAEDLPAEEEGDQPKRLSAAAVKLAKAAKLEAQRLMGVNPLFGMKAPEVEAIRGKTYRDQPAQGITGDRDQGFVNWLWQKHPADAVIRYAYRDIWPTVMPGKVALAEPVIDVGRAPRVTKPAAVIKAKKPAPKPVAQVEAPKPAKQPKVKPALEVIPVSKPGKIRVIVKAKA